MNDPDRERFKTSPARRYDNEDPDNDQEFIAKINEEIDRIKRDVCIEVNERELRKRAYSIARDFGPGVHTVKSTPSFISYECADVVFTHRFVIYPTWICRIFRPQRYREAMEAIRKEEEREASMMIERG